MQIRHEIKIRSKESFFNANTDLIDLLDFVLTLQVLTSLISVTLPVDQPNPT